MNFRGGVALIQGVMHSFNAYSKYRLTPSLTSDLEMMTWIHTSMSQWISSWLVGRRQRRINM